MARFIGTKEEFHTYIGPIARNIVQQLSRKLKRHIGRCMCCQRKVKSLEFAHKAGCDRRFIIDSILDNHYKTDSQLYDVPLEKFIEQFIDFHTPLYDTGYVLCKSCHTEYDLRNGFDHEVTYSQRSKNAYNKDMEKRENLKATKLEE